MKRRWTIPLFVMGVIGSGIVLLLCGPREPVCHGRSLGVWLNIIENTQPLSPEHQEAVNAALKIDATAIPWLLKELDARDSLVGSILKDMAHGFSWGAVRHQHPETRRRHAVLGFTILGPIARPALPALLERLENPDSADHAANALAGVCGTFVLRRGQYSEFFPRRSDTTNHMAIPPEQLTRLRAEVLAQFRRVATNGSWSVRRAVVTASADFSEESGVVVPLLLARLKDNDTILRAASANALSRLIKEPATVVPALIEALSDLEDSVRTAAATALGNYSHHAKTAVPALQRALADSDLRVRAAALAALRRIEPKEPEP